MSLKPKVSTLTILIIGLWIFGTGDAIIVAAGLGVAPWTVLAQGIAQQITWTLGQTTFLVSIIVLFLWIPIKERPGVGTILNAILIALAIDVMMPYLPNPDLYIFQIIQVLIGTLLTAFLKTKSLVLFFSIIVFLFGAYLMLKNETNQIKSKITFFKKLIFGFISGIICAPMGITGAMMNVPILRYFGYPINVAIGCSSGIGFMISLFGAIGFFISGYYLNADLPLSIGFVNIPAFLIFIPITTFMARFGANTVYRMNKIKAQRLLRKFPWKKIGNPKL
mgnify:CR=1 FL=1